MLTLTLDERNVYKLLRRRRRGGDEEAEEEDEVTATEEKVVGTSLSAGAEVGW